jgi:hypothetical protein
MKSGRTLLDPVKRDHPEQRPDVQRRTFRFACFLHWTVNLSGR